MIILMTLHENRVYMYIKLFALKIALEEFDQKGLLVFKSERLSYFIDSLCQKDRISWYTSPAMSQEIKEKLFALIKHFIACEIWNLPVVKLGWYEGGMGCLCHWWRISFSQIQMKQDQINNNVRIMHTGRALQLYQISTWSTKIIQKCLHH